MTYFKSSREIKHCEVYLTDKRVIAFDKPSSFFKSVANLFKDSESAFEVPLFSINSIRDGQLGQRNIIILKTADGTEYSLYFNLSGQEWKQSIVDAVSTSEPEMTVKEVGDYIKFKRQQPRLV